MLRASEAPHSQVRRENLATAENLRGYDRDRDEPCAPFMFRVVDEKGRLFDEIHAITGAPPNYWVLQPYLQGEEPVDSYYREGVVGFAVGRSHVTPITTRRSAEELWDQPYALLRPDGLVEDALAEETFDSVQDWQAFLRKKHPNWPEGAEW